MSRFQDFKKTKGRPFLKLCSLLTTLMGYEAQKENILEN